MDGCNGAKTGRYDVAISFASKDEPLAITLRDAFQRTPQARHGIVDAQKSILQSACARYLPMSTSSCPPISSEADTGKSPSTRTSGPEPAQFHRT